MLDQIHIQTMQPLVGQQWILVDFSEQNVWLTLSSVEVHEDSQAFETFSLFFNGPETPFLTQGTYRLHHVELEPVDIFLVPVARSGQNYVYEAVFNLFKQPPPAVVDRNDQVPQQD